MPIRPEYRAFYGVQWRNYRAAIIALRGARCTTCRRTVERYLQLTHTTHDPVTSSTRLLCATCHQRADSRHRLAVWRRNRARRHGQLWLLPEIEYAASPAWAIPREVFAAADAARQGALFA